jgi:hypothetical protein
LLLLLLLLSSGCCSYDFSTNAFALHQVPSCFAPDCSSHHLLVASADPNAAAVTTSAPLPA